MTLHHAPAGGSALLSLFSTHTHSFYRRTYYYDDPSLSLSRSSLFSPLFQRYTFFRTLVAAGGGGGEDFSLLRCAYDDGLLNSAKLLYQHIKDEKNIRSLNVYEFMSQATSPCAKTANPDTEAVKRISEHWRDDNYDNTFTVENTSLAIVCSPLNQNNDGGEDFSDDNSDEETENNEDDLDDGEGGATADAAAPAKKAAAPTPQTPSVAAAGRGGVGARDGREEEEGEGDEAGHGDEETPPGGRQQELFVVSYEPTAKMLLVNRLTAKWYASAHCASRETQQRFYAEAMRYHVRRSEQDLTSWKGLYFMIALGDLSKVSHKDLTETQWDKYESFPFKLGFATGEDEAKFKKNTLARYRISVPKPHIFYQLFFYLTNWEIQALEATLKGTFNATKSLIIVSVQPF